jgi:hypothetical protein
MPIWKREEKRERRAHLLYKQELGIDAYIFVDPNIK